jgi:hypothetical protein
MPREVGMPQSPEKTSRPCHSERNEESDFSTFDQGAPL